MDNKQLLIIVLAIIIAGLIIGIGCFYGLNQNTTNNMTKNTTNNMTNNTTINVTKISNEDTNNNEKVSDSNNGQSNQEKIEFNGKTHSQNVQEAKQSRANGGQWAGATDAQIEEMIAQEERDGGRIWKYFSIPETPIPSISV